MKKQILCAVLMIALSAGLVFGTGYINDYYIGIPKDARPYDDYALLPKQDGDAAAEKPEAVSLGKLIARICSDRSPLPLPVRAASSCDLPHGKSGGG